MQIQSDETKAGTAIWLAPLRMPSCSFSPRLEVIVDVLDRHRGVVDQDADGQRQAAQGHDVDRLAQRARGMRIELRIESGMEMRDDERAAPVAEEEQDHQRGQARGDARLRRTTPLIEARTKIDWSKSVRISTSSGSDRP